MSEGTKTLESVVRGDESLILEAALAIGEVYRNAGFPDLHPDGARAIALWHFLDVRKRIGSILNRRLEEL